MQDCNDLEQDRFPEDFSAFSKINVMNGPFYDPAKESKAPKLSMRSRVRDLEKEDNASWGKGAPSNVGRQGRMKSKAALAKQEQRVEEDPDDWFGNAAKRSSGVSTRPPKNPKTFTFAQSLSEAKSYNTPNSNPPSLLARIGNTAQDTNRSNRSDRRESRDNYSGSRRSHHDRPRHDERSSSDRYPDRNRRHVDSGPRYKGGYGR